jgi:hypothetical protein
LRIKLKRHIPPSRPYKNNNWQTIKEPIDNGRVESSTKKLRLGKILKNVVS